jgi:hypothetical protein
VLAELVGLQLCRLAETTLAVVNVLCLWHMFMHSREERALGQLCRRALDLMDNFSAQGLSLLAWGLARLDYRHADLLAALPGAAKSRVRR